MSFAIGEIPVDVVQYAASPNNLSAIIDLLGIDNVEIRNGGVLVCSDHLEDTQYVVVRQDNGILYGIMTPDEFAATVIET
jgi:hypothetical protein